MNVEDFQAAFCSLRHFAHRAFCAAMILLRAAGDNGRLVLLAADAFSPLALAQRARAAAAIRARPAADSLPLRPRELVLVPSAERALLRRSSCAARRLRSRSS